MSDVARLSLIDKLFAIVNEENAGADPDCMLAGYFLEHYTELDSLNALDIAEECFVSRSSVRRFCQRVGFENFRELKNSMKHSEHSYDYFLQYAKQEHYTDHFTRELISMAMDLNHRCSPAAMEKITGRIHDSERVVFLTSYSSYSVVHDFQRPLVLSGKVVSVRIELYEADEQLASLGPNDLVFVVSAMGAYARRIMPMLEKCGAYKYLLTASRQNDLKTVYDEVFHLSPNDYDGVKSWAGKYGLFYFFDVLYSEYVRKYDIKYTKK